MNHYDELGPFALCRPDIPTRRSRHCCNAARHAARVDACWVGAIILSLLMLAGVAAVICIFAWSRLG